MKAIIMSHERGGSYVLDREGCFHFAKGHTAQPIGAEVELKPHMLLHLHRAAAIAACLVVTAILGCLGWLWNTESYSVYVDINPSVELVFNNLNRLKAARPLNEDGAALLKGLTLRGSPSEVVVDLLEAAKLEDRVTRSDTKGKVPVAVITVLAREGKAPEQYEAMILAALNKYGLNGLADIIVCDQDIRDRAAGLGISPGKLKLAEQLFALDQSTPVDELTKLSVVDLMAKIGQEQLDGNSAPEAQEKPEIFGTNSGSNATSSTPVDIAVDNGGNGGSSAPQAYADAGSGNGDAAKTDNIGTGADSGNASSSSKADNPGTGSGNNGSSSKPDDSGTSSGSSGGSSKATDSDTGSDDSGGSSAADDSDDTDSSPKTDNPNKGPGNNSGNDNSSKTDNPNKGSGNNSGNASEEDNPNKGPGNNSGNANSKE